MKRHYFGHSQIWRRTWIWGVLALIVVVGGGIGLRAQASSAVIPRINEALRIAQIPVTPAHQVAWMACVVARHVNCTSFASLVDSMTWHRQQYDEGLRDTVVPDATKFISTIIQPITEPVKTATGTVVSYNAPQACRVSTKAGQVTISISLHDYLRFRLPCGVHADPGIQVGATAIIQYRGQGPVRRGLKIVRATNTPLGIGSDSGDCPTCGNDAGGSTGYGS